MNVRCLVIGGGRNWTRPDAPLPSGRLQYGSKGGIAERRENLLATRDLVHLLYAYRCRRRVFMAMISMEFDHAHYI